MFDIILKTSRPLICGSTRDLLHIDEIVNYYAPPNKKVVKVENFNDLTSNSIKPNTIYWRIAIGTTSGRTIASLHEVLREANSQIVYINLENPPRQYTDVGYIATPKKLIDNLLHRLFPKSPKDKIANLIPAFGGMTLQEIEETVEICQATYGKVTAQNLVKIRGKNLAKMDGLSFVDTFTPFYLPNKEWADFATRERKFFFGDYDPRLKPRGAVLDGDPGTGKTMGVKYLASRWGIPLYRMDAGMQSKWVGESEKNLKKILEQAIIEAPCILLLDEAEKIFGRGENQYVHYRESVLSILLWFMQENPPGVFIAMSTNNVKLLPKELIREGRIDRVFNFKGLSWDTAEEFMMSVVKTIEGINPDDYVTHISEVAKELYSNDTGFADVKKQIVHSELTQHALMTVKNDLMGAND